MRWMEYLLLTDKNIRYDTKIYFRPIGVTDRPSVLVANSVDSSDTGKSEDAGRPGFLRAEARGEGWKIV